MVTRLNAGGTNTAAVTTGSRAPRQSASGFAELVRRGTSQGNSSARTAASTAAAAPAAAPPQQVTAAASPEVRGPADATTVAPQAGLPYAFSREGIENHMNQWLMALTQQQNEVRMQNYNNAVDGWKNVNARNRELGLPEIPPPPAPDLAEVSPMPAGWWFEIHS